jgi:hypothetical protein
MAIFSSIRQHKPEDRPWMKDRWRNDMKRVTENLGLLEKMSYLMSSVADHAINSSFYCLFFENDQDQFLDYFAIANLSRTWHWKLMREKGSFTVELPGANFIVTDRVESNLSVRFDTWVDGVYLAMILRDVSALKVYRAVPYEPLHNRMGAIMDEFNGFHHRFLVSVGVDDQEAGQSISNMFDHVQGKRADYESQDLFWVDQVTLPYLELWKALLANDESAFNVALRTQQKGWKKAYSSEDRLRNEIHGYYCMPALAACALAFDRGMKITVKSDYLPVFLIKGEYRMQWPDLEWVK